jgi:hypothetical protein
MSMSGQSPVDTCGWDAKEHLVDSFIVEVTLTIHGVNHFLLGANLLNKTKTLTLIASAHTFVS